MKIQKLRLALGHQVQDMNTLAYIIYLLLTYLLTVHAGMRFYRNGRVYIKTLLGDDNHLADAINRLLLTGYYLLNLGYAALMIRCWKTVSTPADLITSVADKTGTITLTLALVHFCNMLVIFLASRKKQTPFIHHTN